LPLSPTNKTICAIESRISQKANDESFFLSIHTRLRLHVSFKISDLQADLYIVVFYLLQVCSNFTWERDVRFCIRPAPEKREKVREFLETPAAKTVARTDFLMSIQKLYGDAQRDTPLTSRVML
jgi:hypothetical protein